VELAEALLVVDLYDFEAHRAVAGAFEKLGWIDQAVFCLEQARLLPNSPPSFDADLARLYERRGSFSQARELTQPALPAAEEVQREMDLLCREIEAAPAVAVLYLHLARLYRSQGAPLAARRWLLRGLREAGNDGGLALELAEVDLDIFRHDLSVAEDKLRAQPASADLETLRARLVHEINNREISIFQQKADRYRADLCYRFELGVRLLKAGQFDEALAAFEQARADERLRWRSLVYAAYCHLNRRQWPKAKPLLEEALPLIPINEMMHKEVMSLLAQGG
jgi:tetratricopeptide (TPR) repeat protein